MSAGLLPHDYPGNLRTLGKSEAFKQTKNIKDDNEKIYKDFGFTVYRFTIGDAGTGFPVCRVAG